ncbi:MAG: UPF0280 family protein [Desulfofustis sp.]|nr:UPF0280 family protein [Desulfofustis sp.]
MSYRQRTYRSLVDRSALIATQVRLRETDLQILAERDVTQPAGELVAGCRLQIESYIERHRDFAESLTPLPEDDLAPPLVRRMLAAAVLAGVGPMAAVAGAIAEYVGNGLVAAGCKEVIVENGGDIFLRRSRPCTIAVFAGRSPLSYRVGLHLMAQVQPWGVCTSSGTIGHSLSLGLADSVTVVADSAAVADAAATRLGNEAGADCDPNEAVSRVLAAAGQLPAIRGVLVICGEVMGAVGDIELVPLT